MKILNEGAEAVIIQINSETLKKIRLPKPYRISELDSKLRKSRNKREFKVLNKLHENKVNVPKPLEIFDIRQKTQESSNSEIKDDKEEISFTFEFIEGKNLKFVLNEELLNKKLLEKAFDNIIKIHNLDIVHGDLSTLNMLVSNNNLVYLIDFGLSEFSIKIEDKAVDLHLFFNCLKNEHPEAIAQKQYLLGKYESEVKKGKEIVKRLENIEKRGRNK